MGTICPVEQDTFQYYRELDSIDANEAFYDFIETRANELVATNLKAVIAYNAEAQGVINQFFAAVFAHGLNSAEALVAWVDARDLIEVDAKAIALHKFESTN